MLDSWITFQHVNPYPDLSIQALLVPSICLIFTMLMLADVFDMYFWYWL